VSGLTLVCFQPAYGEFVALHPTTKTRAQSNSIHVDMPR